MTYTKFISKENTLNELIKANDKLLQTLNKISVALDNDLYPKDKTSYHFLVELFYPETRMEKTLFASLGHIMQKAEHLSSGSGYLTVLFSSILLKELIKSNFILETQATDLEDLIEETSSYLKSAVSKSSKIVDKAKLYKQVKKVCGNEVLANAAIQAMELAGLEGKMHVTDGIGASYLIELKNGYDFKLNPYSFFFDKGDWEERNVKLLIIDGVVETVSSLDTILNKTFQTKTPLVIMAYNFSEEVIATLKTNMDRGIINVLPVRFLPGLESLNMANDIAVAAGGDIVSAHKGEQIQFIDYDWLPVVEKVFCSSEKFIIENNNPKIQSSISNHLKYLLKKRQENSAVEDVQNLLDARIKSLFSHTVSIHLPATTKNEKDEMRTKLDIAFRTCKTLLSYGFVNLNTLIKNIHNQNDLVVVFKQVLEKSSKEMADKEVPALSVVIAALFSIKTVLTLLSAHGFVEQITDW